MLGRRGKKRSVSRQFWGHWVCRLDDSVKPGGKYSVVMLCLLQRGLMRVTQQYMLPIQACVQVTQVFVKVWLDGQALVRVQNTAGDFKQAFIPAFNRAVSTNLILSLRC